MLRGYTIDLSHGVRPAIRLFRANLRFLLDVESLIISRPGLYYHGIGSFLEDELYHLLTLVGRCLPRLQTVSIHLDNLELPVFILTAFLQEAQGLFDLGLFNVQLSGSPVEFDEMEEALQDHVCLEGVRLVHCKRQKDDYAASLSGTDSDTESAGTIKRIPSIFCRSRNLRRLWLQDCPDNHIVAVANAIHEGDTQLKELSIVSSQVGDNGVESLSQMLQAKTTLDVLRVTLFRGQAMRMAESVAANSSLKKLTCEILVSPTKSSLLTDGPKRI